MQLNYITKPYLSVFQKLYSKFYFNKYLSKRVHFKTFLQRHPECDVVKIKLFQIHAWQTNANKLASSTGNPLHFVVTATQSNGHSAVCCYSVDCDVTNAGRSGARKSCGIFEFLILTS